MAGFSSHVVTGAAAAGGCALAASLSGEAVSYYQIRVLTFIGLRDAHQGLRDAHQFISWELETSYIPLVRHKVCVSK